MKSCVSPPDCGQSVYRPRRSPRLRTERYRPNQILHLSPGSRTQILDFPVTILVTFLNVRIIGKAAITKFSAAHEDAKEALLHWYHVSKRAGWRNIAETRQDFSHADAAGKFTVFNIGGNKYRLITIIKYRWQIVYIRYILTHKEYTQGKWKES